MAVSERVRDALNAQVRRELQAAYLYLSMANWFEEESLPGFASWMRAQSEEERDHAFRLIDHLHDRGARVELEALEAPTGDFGSPLDALRAALEHEQAVTGHIHDLYEMAREEGDHPAAVMLEWFVEEQVEEEDTFQTLVDHLERDGSGASLLVMDGKLEDRGGG